MLITKGLIAPLLNAQLNGNVCVIVINKAVENVCVNVENCAVLCVI